MSTNPFEKEENLRSWLEGDSFYNKSKKLSLQKFKTEYDLAPAWLENFYSKYLGFVQTFSRHVVASTLVLLLMLSFVSASAAQLFAPEQYKPSNLFKDAENTQVESKTLKLRLSKNNPFYEIDANYETGTKKLNYEGKIETKGGCGILQNQDTKKENGKIVISFVIEKQTENCDNPSGMMQVKNQVDLELSGSEIDRFNDIFEVKIELLEPVVTESEVVKPKPLAPPAEILVADEVSHVAVVNECDLAMKFPKTINFPESNSAVEGQTSVNGTFPLKPNAIVLQKSFSLGVSYPFGDGQTGIGVECFSPAISFDQFNSSFTDFDKRFDPSITDPATEQPTEIVDIGKIELCQHIKLNAASCEKIENTKKMIVYGIEPQMRIYYYFTFADKSYLVSASELFEAHFGTSFGMQFNSLAPSVATTEFKNIPKTLTYSNEYYPNLNIVYDDTWQFETTTSESIYKGLLNRRIVLSKNQSKLTFNVDIKYPTGCAGGEDVNHLTELRSNLYRYQTDPNKYVYMATSSAPQGCVGYPVFNLDSTLPRSSYPEYDGDINPGPNVIEAFVSVRLDSTNPEEIKEVDQIVMQSSFWSVR